MDTVRFVDRVKLCLKAGRGGEGSSARRRFRTHFVNWGGDGGRGGSIYIQADPNVFDLSKFINKVKFTAQEGQPGLSNNKHGGDAKDLLLSVPLGTRIEDENATRRGSPRSRNSALFSRRSAPKAPAR